MLDGCVAPDAYHIHMIENFRHKGLKALFEDDDSRKVGADQAARIRLILSALIRPRPLKTCGSRHFGCIR
jgi:plasmid maintenance system killer protein